MADRSRWSDAAYVIAARGASREVLPVRGGAENSQWSIAYAIRKEPLRRERSVLRFSEVVRGLACDLALIYGEEVALRDDGRSDFGALMAKRGGLMR